MNIILLSGGSGKRLWPLSNDIRSKQFIKFFKKSDGDFESMIERVYRQIYNIDKKASITISTNKTQSSSIKNQLGNNIDLCIEPDRRDTFPAIALSVSYLHDIKKIPKNEYVAICPIDPYVNDDYFQAIKELYTYSSENKLNLSLLGVDPSYPSEKYGYIIPSNIEYEYSEVIAFKEKPTSKMAKEYISNGALWNCGVFVVNIGYILDIIKNIIGYNNYDNLLQNYSTLEKISFDYAVVEQEKNLIVKKYIGDWKDIGTWNTLVSEMNDISLGKVIQNDTCDNINVLNELNLPIICMGLKDLVIATSSSGILISDKHQSSYIKPFVDILDDRVMFAEKSWGKYEVINIENNSMIIKVTLNKNKHMNYHSHQNRDEIWTVIEGDGRVCLDGICKNITLGDVIYINKNTKHSVITSSSITLIEIQIGEDISIEDKSIYELNNNEFYNL